MNMKQYKWLVVPLLSLGVAMGYLAAVGCDLGGIRELRGNAALFVALVFLAFSFIPILYLAGQALLAMRSPQSSGSKMGVVAVIIVLIPVVVFLINILTKQYCY